jgi:hypothetical protein
LAHGLTDLAGRRRRCCCAGLAKIGRNILRRRGRLIDRIHPGRDRLKFRVRKRQHRRVHQGRMVRVGNGRSPYPTTYSFWGLIVSLHKYLCYNTPPDRICWSDSQAKGVVARPARALPQKAWLVSPIHKRAHREEPCRQPYRPAPRSTSQTNAGTAILYPTTTETGAVLIDMNGNVVKTGRNFRLPAAST